MSLPTLFDLINPMTMGDPMGPWEHKKGFSAIRQKLPGKKM
jgi:hypothetical protein